jgi:ubiquinone/menaquinone biosynthesis C-methylase UbiE
LEDIYKEKVFAMQISHVKRTKQTARATYNHLSRFYDLLAGSSETPLMQRGLDMLAVQRGESVLEIGPGTGKALVELGKHVGESGRVHGIDLSRGMLQQSYRRLVPIGLSGRVSLIEADGAQLPYACEIFTAVFISFTLELFDTPEIPLVLQECQRVLKPSGHLGVVALLKSEPVGRIVRLYEWFHHHFPTYVDCRPIEAKAAIQLAGFRIENDQVKSLWGLPVALVLARKV